MQNIIILDDPVFYTAGLFVRVLKNFYISTHYENGTITEAASEMNGTAFQHYIRNMFPKSFPAPYISPYYMTTFVMLENALYEKERSIWPDEVEGYLIAKHLSMHHIDERYILDRINVPLSMEFLYDDTFSEEVIRNNIRDFIPCSKDEFVTSLENYCAFISRKQ